ncbi:Rhodopsin, GQ-coupled [Holothuria leucospilota]|uniref:Rhodopsin, GQ-coupled n=1 Tax=Holothuria leucospilota TaxID=206669 RepID=A0A9Q0YK36_HOLLE|nr:Rhodopsin, GQ-coupled [Holothuria leucospilota]
MDITALYNQSVVTEISATSCVILIPLNTTATPMQEKLPPQMRVALMVIVSLIFIVGVVGNTLAIFIFIRTKALHTPPNFLIVNLSISDLAMIVSNSPMMLTSIHNGSWQYGYIGCQLYAFCGAIFSFVSIGSMAAIAIDRYYVICHCFHALMNVSRGRTLIIIFLVWFYAFIWSIPPFLGLGAYIEEGYGIGCTFDFVSQDLNTKVHVVLLYVGGFLSPVTVVVVCYSKIVGTVKKHKKEIERYSRTGPQGKNDTSVTRRSVDTGKKPNRVFKKVSRVMAQYQLARVGIIATVVYCMSWGPYALIALYSEFLSPKSTLKPTVQVIPVLFAKMSSIWNPFVYAVSHTRYKKALYHTVRKGFKCLSTGLNNETESQELKFDFSRSPRDGSESAASIKRSVNVQTLPDSIVTDKENNIPLPSIKKKPLNKRRSDPEISKLTEKSISIATDFYALNKNKTIELQIISGTDLVRGLPSRRTWHSLVKHNV